MQSITIVKGNAALLEDRPASPEPPEAVIREARRRQHRRWLVAGIVALVSGLLVAGVTWLVAGSTGRGHVPTTTPPRTPKSLPVRVLGLQPTQPGPLAVAANGTLYIADEAQNRILARLPSGQFRVVAGNGSAGFSGDGGLAVDAELNGPQGIAVAANGTIYFADFLNNRIRAVSPEGTITTVAGNGQSPGTFAAPTAGSPAVGASINEPTAVAIGPDGSVYFAEAANVLEIRADGSLSVLEDGGAFDSSDLPSIYQQQCYPASLAADGSGDLYIECSEPWLLARRSADGTLHYLARVRPHDAWAAMTTTPGGGVLALDGADVLAFGSAQRPPTADFGAFRLPDGTNFWPQGIAVGGDGTVYLAQDGVSGIGTAAVVRESPNGKVTVLWQGKPARN